MSSIFFSQASRARTLSEEQNASFTLQAVRVAGKRCGLFYAVSSSPSSVGHVRSPLPSCVAQHLAFQEATPNRKNDGCGLQPRETGRVGRAPPLTQIHGLVSATMVVVSWERVVLRSSCPSWFCLFLRSDCYRSAHVGRDVHRDRRGLGSAHRGSRDREKLKYHFLSLCTRVFWCANSNLTLET